MQYNIVDTYIENNGLKTQSYKTALVDNGRTNKWLAEQFGKDPATVSKWCTNACQPSLKTLMQIAKLLNVQADELLRFDKLPEIVKNDMA